MSLVNVLLDTNTGAFVSGLNRPFGDAAGALRVSQLNTTGQYTFYGQTGNFFDQKTLGGTITDDTINARKVLSVTAGVGNYAVIQTRQSHPYFAGNPQRITETYSNLQYESGTIKRIGYFDSDFGTPYSTALDGIWIESNGNDSTYYLVISKNGTQNKIPRSAWVDKLDGTGESGMTWNPQNFNVFEFDFLFLGGTGVEFNMFNGRVPAYMHTYNHANNEPLVIINTPQKPIRYEIRSTGGAGTLHAICAQVGTSGSIDGIAGIKASLPYQLPISGGTAGSQTHIRSMRLKTGFETEFVQNLGFSALSATNDNVFLKIVFNGTITEGTWTSVPNSVIEYNEGATYTESTGQIIYSEYLTASTSSTALLKSLRRLGAGLDGNRDVVSVICTPLSSGSSIGTSLQWIEFG